MEKRCGKKYRRSCSLQMLVLNDSTLDKPYAEKIDWVTHPQLRNL